MNERQTDGPLISTGIPGLDDVLSGGLDPDRLYLIEGEPGTGKTTIALQFLLEGASRGEKGLCVTLSESERELRLVAFQRCVCWRRTHCVIADKFSL